MTIRLERQQRPVVRVLDSRGTLVLFGSRERRWRGCGAIALQGMGGNAPP